MHCTEKILWCDKKAFCSGEDIEKYLATVASTEKSPSEPGSWRGHAGMIGFLWTTALQSTSNYLRAAKSGVAARWRKVTAASGDLRVFCAPGMARSLGPSAARLLVKHAKKSRVLRLDGLAALDPETALVLATHGGDLHLNGITSLVPETAKALSQHRGVLSLNGLAELTVAAAEQLITHVGAMHMTSLKPSPSTASVLSRHRKIHLSSEARAIMTAACGLQKKVHRHGEKRPQGNPGPSRSPAQRGDASAELRVLSPKLAKRLVAHTKGRLKLNSVKEMSPLVTRIVAARRGELSLDGLVQLSDPAANELARHVGDLSLNGLFSLTAECAESLAGHRGGIEMNGLLSLLPECAAAFERHKHWLSLNGLRRISDDTAARLSRHPGDLQLNGIRDVSVSVASHLSQHRHWISLDGVEFVDANVAAELARFRGTQLWLRGLINAEPEVVATLRRNPSIWLPVKLSQR